MESHPSGDPLQRGERTSQNRTPNPHFTFFREYRTPEMKRQTRFCRLFTVCLFAASANVITNRKLTSYNAFLHRKMRTFVQRLIHAYIRLLCCIIMKTHVLHGPTVCRSKKQKVIKNIIEQHPPYINLHVLSYNDGENQGKNIMSLWGNQKTTNFTTMIESLQSCKKSILKRL